MEEPSFGCRTRWVLSPPCRCQSMIPGGFQDSPVFITLDGTPHRKIDNLMLYQHQRSAILEWTAQHGLDINLTDYQMDITNSLKILDPVDFAGIRKHILRSRKLVPIVRLEGSSEPIALRSMGDGMVRLFNLGLGPREFASPAGAGSSWWTRSRTAFTTRSTEDLMDDS